MTIIAWAYMVELEDGLSKPQLGKLIDVIPEKKDVFPLHLNDNTVVLEANSMAIGFIDNDYFDETSRVQQTLASICNDWNNEREDKIYTVAGEGENDEDSYKVMLLCDYETIR